MRGEAMSYQSEITELIEKYTRGSAYKELHWEGTIADYLEMVGQSPAILRNAFQRIYDMIVSYGVEEYTENKEKLVRYQFFSDPGNEGEDAVYGLEKPLMHLVNIFKSASRHYGTERRVLLLHGPVGSAKSTIVPPFLENINGKLQDDLKIFVDGELCPFCRFTFRNLMQQHSGDLKEVLNHVLVHRLILSEQDRIGIGTFQPKDEKNQDSTELTGDINYRKIATYGSDSDPRAFNFDGEFNVANRGVIEFVEVLKLDVAFLYDLLGASQEHVIKPKKFPQTDIDEVIIGHTNEPEYKKLQNNEFMEALRDRTVKIDVPYITCLDDELKIYEKDYRPEKVQGKHIAPHTLEMAAMWATLTRLEEPKKANLTLLNSNSTMARPSPDSPKRTSRN
jgi:serine protein kinase